MSDRDWQHTVLNDLGALDAGLVPPSRHPLLAPLPLFPTSSDGIRVPTTTFSVRTTLATTESSPPVTAPSSETVTSPRLEPASIAEALTPPPQEPDIPRVAAHPDAMRAVSEYADWTSDQPGPPHTEPAVSPSRTAPPQSVSRMPDGHASATAYERELLRRNPHGDPLMRRLGQGVRKAVGTSTAGQARDTAELTARISAPVSSCRRIAVTSIRGGAGKSTLAALIADVIREHRGDRVVAVDADPGLGSLTRRLGVNTSGSMLQLAAARPQAWAQVEACLARTHEGLYVLPAAPAGAIADELDPAVFHRATGPLHRYFSAAVIDCAGGLTGSLLHDILAGSHAQVFVVPGTVDGAMSARAAINWIHQNGFAALLTRTVIALVVHTPSPDADLERARQLLSTGGIPVILVPFDRHLAAGTTVSRERVGMPTATAATQITAEAFTRAVGA